MSDTRLNTNTHDGFLNRAYEWGRHNPGKVIALAMVTTAALSVLAIIGASYLPPTLHAQSSLPPMQPITAPSDNLFYLLPFIPIGGGITSGILYYAGSKIEEKLDESDTFKRMLVRFNPFQEIKPIILPQETDNN